MKMIEPIINADIGEVVVFEVEIVEREIQDEYGKQVHCPTFEVISCKHGHAVVVQFVVKQPTKLKMTFFE